jgi:hypothetical protein
MFEDIQNKDSGSGLGKVLLSLLDFALYELKLGKV